MSVASLRAKLQTLLPCVKTHGKLSHMSKQLSQVSLYQPLQINLSEFQIYVSLLIMVSTLAQKLSFVST